MPTNIETQLQELLDKEAIFDVIRLERFWRDQKEWDQLLDCFTEDATVCTTWYDGSAKGFVEASIDMAKRGTGAKHLIFPTYVKINGDRAIAESMGEIHIRTSVDGVEADLNQYCRFFSRLRRTDAGWKLASFEGIYQRDTLKPVNSSQALPVDWDAIAKLRPTYRFLNYVLSQGGWEIPDTRIADDRPDLVQAFYRAAEEWLADGD